jgi:hypothetical protein
MSKTSKGKLIGSIKDSSKDSGVAGQVAQS